MVDPDVRSAALTLDGRWRITRFGKFEQNPASTTRDLKIEAFLGRLLNESDTATLDKTGLRKRSVLVGEIPRLPINTVLLNGKPTTEKRDFGKRNGVELTLNCRREDIHVFDRFKKDEDRILIMQDNLWSKDVEQSKNTLFVGFKRGSDPFGIIIPCYEIFRFFYATSDVITKALLSSRFLDPATHIWNPEKSGLSKNKTGYLWLRKRMLDSDARFIARFAFDPYALQCAQDIFLHAAAIHSQETFLKLRAVPPFEDSVKIQGLGKKLNDGRILIFEILTCDYQPNFIELHWDRDNDGRYDPDHREERDPIDYGGNLLQSSANSNISNLGDTPPASNIPPARLQLAEIRARFPALAEVPTEKLPQDDTKARSGKQNWKTAFADVIDGSVSEGQSSEELVGTVIIEGKEKLPQSKPTLSKNINPNTGDFFEYILHLLKEIEELGEPSIRQLVFTNEYALYKGVAYNLFPAEIHGKRPAWLFSDEDRQYQRMILVAEITFNFRTRYIIEIQQRMHHRCSTLIVWNEEESIVSEMELHELLLDCAEVGSARFPSANSRGFYWGRREHTAKLENKNSGKLFLTKVMTTTPK